MGSISNSDYERFNPSFYTGKEQIGKSAIEREYEHILRGTPGTQKLLVNVRGRVMEQIEKDAFATQLKVVNMVRQFRINVSSVQAIDMHKEPSKSLPKSRSNILSKKTKEEMLTCNLMHRQYRVHRTIKQVLASTYLQTRRIPPP